MTLTAALRLALDPATKEEGIRAICDYSLSALSETQNGVATDRLDTAIAAGLVLFGCGVAPHMAARLPAMMEHLGDRERMILCDATMVVRAGWDSPHTSRSAEWTAAAERLAAWADGQTTPEEP